ncbi:MAG: FliM/FliN family flagellar motor switch protein [Terracidiphilus sp.]|jgi:flagellar motor switch protein FliM
MEAAPAPAKARSIQRCNFRATERLTNEDARALTAMHERIAQRVADVLDAYLGTAPAVKFATIAQLPAKDYAAEVPPLSYIMPFASGLVAAEFDLDLAFPMIELLMGGTGDAKSSGRDLTEIEEEIMHDIALLVMREVDTAWAVPGVSMAPGARIRPAMMLQSFRPSERVTVLRFEVTLGNAYGAFSLALSTGFCDLLIKKIREERPQKRSRVWSFPSPPLRERILDCETEVVAELPGLRVTVKDLVTLQPGSVLKLRAPIRTPGMLTAGGRGLFEAMPVRSGLQRAAQLGRRTQTTDWKRR